MTRAASPAVDEPGRRGALTAASLALWAAASAMLLLYAWQFLPFLSDDSLISLRYAERLLAGDGLTWTDGERVEGYSNLLWVLGVAGLAPLLGGDLILAARALGVLSMAAVLAALFHAFWPGRPRDLLAPAAAAFAIAACAPMAIWAIGGLEQPLFAALLAWSLALALPLAGADAPATRRILRAGAPLALLCVTRPDGVLFALAIGLGLLIGRSPRWSSLRVVLILAILPAALVAGQLGFRLAYYGEWVPNTAHAKVSLSSLHLLRGYQYVTRGARGIPMLPLAALAALALLWLRPRRPRAAVLLVSLLIWAGYVAVIGGDIFPAYRHLVPLVVVAAFLLAEATAALAPLGRRVPAGLAAFALVPVTAWSAHTHFEIDRARLERWEWDGKVVGELLQRAFGPRAPLLAVDAAGCVPFFSRLPSLDLLGLNDRYLATHPPPDFGRGWIGHELGDGAYVLRRKPDLLLFCTPQGSARGCFRSGSELLASQEFRRDYARVHYETPPPRGLSGTLWVRRDGVAGLRRSPTQLQIPGLLFTANPATIMRASPDGTFEAAVPSTAPARIQSLAVPAGAWRLDARTSGPSVVRVALPDGQALSEGAPPLDLTLAAPADLTIEVRARDQAITLADLVLQSR